MYGDDLNISVSLDQNQQCIDVVDDAGGLHESDLLYIVGPGHTRSLDTDQTIGIFGVGTKRAVVALAQDVTIRTRQDAATYAIEFDDDWINRPEFFYELKALLTQAEAFKFLDTIAPDPIGVRMENYASTSYEVPDEGMIYSAITDLEGVVAQQLPPKPQPEPEPDLTDEDIYVPL